MPAPREVLSGRLAAQEDSGLADDHLADLHDRRQIRVVRNVGHDLARVRTEAGLEGFHRVAEDMAHGNVGGRLAWTPATQSLVYRVELAAIPHPGLHERHVFVAVVRMVEPSAWLVRIHHAYLDHELSPSHEPLGSGSHRAREMARGRTRRRF